MWFYRKKAWDKFDVHDNKRKSAWKNNGKMIYMENYKKK